MSLLKDAWKNETNENENTELSFDLLRHPLVHSSKPITTSHLQASLCFSVLVDRSEYAILAL